MKPHLSLMPGQSRLVPEILPARPALATLMAELVLAQNVSAHKPLFADVARMRTGSEKARGWPWLLR